MNLHPTRPEDLADFAVVEVVAGAGDAPILLVCEHASPEIPPAFAGLGIAPGQRRSHAVWDPGAEALTRRLALRIGATAVVARISRAVYDLNRPPHRADATPVRSEIIEIPGNLDLSPDERDRRARLIHDPFHARVAEALDALPPGGALVTVHSFTPVWHGEPRETEIGLLHDADARLARAMLAAAEGPLRVDLNLPYSAADGVTYTLAKHATARGIPSVMIEVRNDLLSGEAGVSRTALQIGAMLDAALPTLAGAA